MSFVKYLTTEKICELLAIKKTYLSRLINEKQFPVIKLGHRSLRFDERAVKNWINKHKQGTES